MTMPPISSDFDAESDEDDALSRVTVFFGSHGVDVGLPTRVTISELIPDVFELADDQLPSEGRGRFAGVGEANWTFARLAGDALDPNQSLAEAGVADGDLLLVHEADRPSPTRLIDEFDRDVRPVLGAAPARWSGAQGRTAVWSAIGIVAAIAAARTPANLLTLPGLGGPPVVPTALLLAGFGLAVTGWVLSLRSDRTAAAPWLVATSIPLIFGGALHVVPGSYGVASLAVAATLVALVALLQLLIVGGGRAFYTTLVAIAVFGVPLCLIELFSDLDGIAAGAILATLAVMTVYIAPRVTIGLSRLPLPRVPTAGEPLDDIETMGGTVVEGVNAVGKQVIATEEGIAERVRRASDYLTGIVAAAAIMAVVGSYLSVRTSAGLHWQGAVFALVVAVVMCLRGRSHHDMLQSAVLIGGGLVAALAVIAKIAIQVDGWQFEGALALVAVMLVSIACGLIAPGLDFSPVMRRWAEILEYFAIATLFPLAGAVIGVYAYFRGLRL